MRYFLTTGLPAILVVFAGIMIERVLASLITRAGERKGIPVSQSHLIRLIVRWTIALIVAIVIASIFGISVANFWTAISAFVVMVLVGFFAVWSFLSNILATVVILISRPFIVGDTITILPENLSGELVDIGLIFSKIKTPEGDLISFTNNTFVTKLIRIASPKGPEVLEPTDSVEG